ncbi:MAG: 3-phosphoshikimate 1-carboxyvinyltransferase [Actinobacteria bacterium]|nr:3-phosphoshikimate 1-carboxyvinyltransferase [Actinomycetota bacterium]
MSSDLWPAPFRGERPIAATITIPGSKSVTNRALILAAIASSPSSLMRPLRSRDTELMMKGLRSLGIKIEERKDSSGEEIWTVTPQPLFGPASIDVGNAGTVMRFLPPLASLARGLINFDGDPRSHERPLGPVISALESLGATIDHKNRYALPLTINGSGEIAGGEVEIDASASSQFVSALLLVGPAMKNGITVRHNGGQIPSQPHIEMTLAMLRDFGAHVEQPSQQEWRVSPGQLRGRELVIEPDLSNAAPFMIAPMICGGKVMIRDWPQSTTQPGDQLREIFTRMGAQIRLNSDGLEISGTGRIYGIDIDLHDVGELTPSIAALAALAESPSYLRGIGHLRLHETDRLSALAREINSLGGDVIEESSALRIKPAKLHGGTFHTYEDHRLATAGAILGLAIDGVQVENIATTRKTLPDFPGLWSSLLEG